MTDVQLKKIGVALGSGAARGLAHIGALEALRENKIPIDYLSGSSVGAIAAVAYAVGTFDKLKKIAQQVKKSNILQGAGFVISKRGKIEKTPIKEFIDQITLDKKFSDCRIPLAIVATDIKKMERVIIREGDLAMAVMSSFCVPGIFQPINYRGKLLVDGGLIDPIPVDILYQMGADYTIAVDVGAPKNHPLVRVGKLTKEQINKLKQQFTFLDNYINNLKQGSEVTKDKQRILKILKRKNLPKQEKEGFANFVSLALTGYRAVVSGLPENKMEKEHYDLLIKPEVGDIGKTEFYKVEKGVKAGKKAVEEKITLLKKQLIIS